MTFFPIFGFSLFFIFLVLLHLRPDCLFGIFLVSEVGLYQCKLPSYDCFGSIPWVLDHCVFICLQVLFFYSPFDFFNDPLLFSNILFSLHICSFAGFSCSWFLVSRCYVQKNMISVFLNILIFVLWPKMWSIPKNVSCTLESGMCILLLWDGLFDAYFFYMQIG